MRGHTAAHCSACRGARHGAAALAGVGLVLALAGCDATDDSAGTAGDTAADGARTPQPISFAGAGGPEDDAESEGVGRTGPSARPAPEAAALAADADWRSAPDGELRHWSPEEQAALEQEAAAALHRHLIRFVDEDGSFLGEPLFTEQGGTLTRERIPGPERASFDELLLKSADTAVRGSGRSAAR